MRILSFLLVILVMFAQSAIAQKKNKEVKKDFIINNSSDTIWGQLVGPTTPAIISVKITFVDDATKEKKIYKPNQIKSWHPGGLDYHFESKEYRPKGTKPEEEGFGVFMKCFTPYDGTVKLYEYYNTDGQEGYTQTFIDRRGKMTEVNFEKFYAQLAEYFADYVDLSTKIKEKKYKKTEIRKIIDEYNLWKNKKA